MEFNESKQKLAVQETASDALLQKIASIEKGYFKDDYQHLFIGKTVQPQKYLPIINKGTWSRVRAIRNQIDYIIEKNSIENNNITQIINLGCGMDSLYFVLKDKYKENLDNKINLLDLDYSEITKQKIKFIQHSEKLQSFLKSEETKQIYSNDKKKLNTKEYSILNCDIVNKVEVETAIKQSNMTNDDLTIIIAECLLCYLNSDDIRILTECLSSYFQNAVLIYYDLINPNDEFGKVMIRNLKVFRNIILPSFEDCPSLKSHIQRSNDYGFKTRNICIDMLTYFNTIIPIKEQSQMNNLELLDELEEWNLLQHHYCIGVGIKINQGFEFLHEYEFK